MSGICRTRLAEERKQWRKDHPFVSCPISTSSHPRSDPFHTPLCGAWMLMSRFRVVWLFLSRVLGVDAE